MTTQKAFGDSKTHLSHVWTLGTVNGLFHLFPYDSKIMKKCHDLNLEIAKDLVIRYLIKTQKWSRHDQM